MVRGEGNRTGRRLLPKSEEGRLKEPVLRVPVAGRRLEEPFQGHCKIFKGLLWDGAGQAHSAAGLLCSCWQCRSVEWGGQVERVSGHLGKERRGAQQLQVVMQARNLNFI